MIASVIDILDSGTLRVAAYGLVAALAALWYLLERRAAADGDPKWFPTYWLLSAVLLVCMGAVRASALGDLVTELGREQARSSGWFAERRTFQAIAVSIVAVLWFVGVIVSIWRFPPRRRRYLPSVVAIGTLVAFAVVRLVSLHHIDAVLYRRDIGGVRIVAIIELALLALVAITTVAVSTSSKPADSAETPGTFPVRPEHRDVVGRDSEELP